MSKIHGAIIIEREHYRYSYSSAENAMKALESDQKLKDMADVIYDTRNKRIVKDRIHGFSYVNHLMRLIGNEVSHDAPPTLMGY